MVNRLAGTLAMNFDHFPDTCGCSVSDFPRLVEEVGAQLLTERSKGPITWLEEREKKALRPI